ncbi:hypothetical protein RCL_jg19064.t1 [Rhizophagus clarus]|uniref:Uncharacterized protein n=1 Tax=Rhizophagus clarus TaxID=94130 RepID=A0A8H3QXA1_9GLOM|nr:hypothetical protein RCL_jg19064.t1 [Rhizophagus clarus]
MNLTLRVFVHWSTQLVHRIRSYGGLFLSFRRPLVFLFWAFGIDGVLIDASDWSVLDSFISFSSRSIFIGFCCFISSSAASSFLKESV